MAINPNEVHERFRLYGEKWANLDGAACMLEETRKSVRAQLMADYGDIAVNRAEMRAEADQTYKDHVKQMVNARKEANLAKVQFDALKAWIDLVRSQEASKREELRRLG